MSSKKRNTSYHKKEKKSTNQPAVLEFTSDPLYYIKGIDINNNCISIRNKRRQQ